MKKLSFFLMAMLVSLTSFAAALGEGYEKVTDISTLAAGDKVVLYADAISTGVTGWDGSKDAKVAADGWVEYLVEAGTSGGVLLKDSAAGKYIAMTTKNAFKYAATGTDCKVNKNGVIYSTKTGSDAGDYFLYQNGSYYRMYKDKSSDSSYKPFYMYKVVPVEVDPDATIYTVTVKSADETMGTVSGGGEYAEGKTATLEATPKAGYEFVKWSNESTDNPLKLTVTEDIELTATFQAQAPITIAEANKLANAATCVLKEFTVTYIYKSYIHIQDASGYGMIYKSNFGLNVGDVVTGFTCSKSTYNGLPQFVPTCAKADLTIVAGEAPAVAELTTAPTGNYHQVVKLMNLTMTGSFNTSSNTTVKATCPDGTTIDIFNGKNHTYTFVAGKTYNITGDVCQYSGKIQVSTYAIEEYVAPVVNHTVTVTANAEGENVVTGAGEYEEGEEVTVTASEDLEGWVFIGWTEDGEFVANDPEYTFVVKGDVELVAVYAMDLGENKVTDLVIDGDNMLLTGSVADFQMGTMNLELALGEYDEEEGTYLLTEESKLYVGETNFTFVDGMAAIDMNTNSAMAIVVFEYNGTYYYMTVNMSKKIEATIIEIADATVTIEERSMGFGDEVYHVLKMESTWSDGETTYPVSLETTEFDQTKESQEVAASITVGGRGDEDPWLGSAEGDVTITVADGVVTVEGLLENAYALPAPIAFDVTISGTLPVVEPTTITWELNGGEFPAVVVPTNEELWIAFMPYYQEYYDVVRAEQPITSVAVFLSAGMGDDATIFTSEDSDYKWLGDYIIKVTTEQSAALTTLANWKFNAQAFFNANQYTGWPKSADFTEAGKPENWGAAYEAAHAVVLPTEPVAEDYVLPTPVKEGYTFVGWYDNAEGTGEAYKVIPAGWAGTLYAIWKQGTTTALENIAVEGKAVKAIINGQLIIIKNGVQYNAQGQVVK